MFHGGYRLKGQSHSLHTDLINQNITANGKRGRYAGRGKMAQCKFPCFPDLYAGVVVYVCARVYACVLGKTDICGLPKVRSQLIIALSLYQWLPHYHYVIHKTQLATHVLPVTGNIVTHQAFLCWFKLRAIQATCIKTKKIESLPTIPWPVLLPQPSKIPFLYL